MLFEETYEHIKLDEKTNTYIHPVKLKQSSEKFQHNLATFDNETRFDSLATSKNQFSDMYHPFRVYYRIFPSSTVSFRALPYLPRLHIPSCRIRYRILHASSIYRILPYANLPYPTVSILPYMSNTVPWHAPHSGRSCPFPGRRQRFPARETSSRPSPPSPVCNK